MSGDLRGIRSWEIAVFTALALVTLIACVCLGSVNIPFADTVKAIWSAIFNLTAPEGVSTSIILSVRLPRVICVALTGAALSLCGAAMQGLLKNPLADGSTMGVSSGASLGAAVAILFGISFDFLPYAGTMATAIMFAFASLAAILALAYALDRSLSTNTIILIGVIFQMFVSALMSLLITFSGEKLRSITFWTMGSLSGSSYNEALILASALALFGGALLMNARELNAFAIGEENARSLGVNVKKVKLTVLICVSSLIGISVSIGGVIGFVGLVIPHMTRFLTGPNHRKLMPVSAFGGAIFLMLSDLAARTLLSPRELPIGVVTSLIGSAAFVVIFRRTRKAGRA